MRIRKERGRPADCTLLDTGPCTGGGYHLRPGFDDDMMHTYAEDGHTIEDLFLQRLALSTRRKVVVAKFLADTLLTNIWQKFSVPIQQNTKRQS